MRDLRFRASVLLLLVVQAGSIGGFASGQGPKPSPAPVVKQVAPPAPSAEAKQRRDALEKRLESELTKTQQALSKRDQRALNALAQSISAQIQAEYMAALRTQDFIEAAYYARRGAKLSGWVLGDGNPDHLDWLLLLAQVNWFGQDFAAVIANCDDVIKLTSQPKETTGVARAKALLILGRAYVELGVQKASSDPAASQQSFATAMDRVEQCLNESNTLLAPKDPLQQAIPPDVVRTISNGLLQRGLVAARSRNATEVANELEHDLGQLQAKLKAAAVAEHWIQLAELWIAKFYSEAQLFDRMAPALRRLDSAFEQQKFGPHERVAYWHLKAVYATAQLDYPSALKYHAKGIEITHDESQWPATDANFRKAEEASSRDNLGVLLAKLGDQDKAREELAAAYEEYRELGCYEPAGPALFKMHAISCSINLAEILRKRGDQQSFDQAADLLNRAIELLNTAEFRAAPEQVEVRPRCLNSLALVHYLRGDLPGAQAFLDQAYDLVKRNGDEHERTGELNINRGWIAFELGQFDQADKLFRSALTAFNGKSGRLQLRAAECHACLARVAVARGANDAAQTALKSAIDLQEGCLRDTLQKALSERDRLAIVQELRLHSESASWPGVLDTYLELAEPLAIAPEEQYRHALAWKRSVLRHALPKAVDLEADPRVQELARQRESAIQKLQATTSALAYSFANQKELSDAEALALAEAEQSIDRISRELVAVSARFKAALAAAVVVPQQVVAALPPHSALLDVIAVHHFSASREGKVNGAADRRYLAFLVRPNAEVIRVQLGREGRASTIDSAIKGFNESLKQGKSTGADGLLLSEALRTPLEGLLSEIDLLILAGDGWLHRLPLAAIPSAVDQSYWVESLAFATVLSAQSLIEQRASKQPANRGSLIVGDIDYGRVGDIKNPDRRTTPWTGISQANAEISQVFEQFQQAGVPVEWLRRRQPTEETLSRSLGNYRFIHIATHGYFLDRNREQAAFSISDARDQVGSAIVLAGANLPPSAKSEDQYLTAAEIAELNLSSTELVVLSGCETGLGRLIDGQGTVGLLGALDEAGARSVLSALWTTHGDGTCALMSAFYQHMLSSARPRTPAIALRAAQLEMIHGQLRKPNGDIFEGGTQYWAPWILSGVTSGLTPD